MAPPVEADPVEAPPLPPVIERPAGEPNTQNWPAWMTYAVRRQERAELAGLYYQGVASSEQHANELNTEQLRQCNAWAAEHDGH